MSEPEPPAHAASDALPALITALPSGVLLADAAGRVVQVNAAFCELFGLPAGPEELVGADCSRAAEVAAGRLLDPDGFLARMEEVMAARVGVTDEVRFADGRVTERDYVPLGTREAAQGHLWMYRDITDRVAAEEARRRLGRADVTAQALGVHAQRQRAQEAEEAHRLLVEQHEALRSIEELRRQLLATASHELRTPLTSMLSFVSLLREGDPMTPEQEQFVAVIGRNADRLLRMVNDMLLLARFGSGAEDLDLDDVDLAGLVAEVVHDVRPTAARRQVTLTETVHPGPPLIGDRMRLTQVVVNLVDNAVKFTPDGGRVAVSVERGRSGWRLAVADTGIGIPAAERDQLFGQFFRASTARRAGIQGTGLGLAICRAIVELHQGDIAVTSNDGSDGHPSGTVVIVTLPDLP